MTTQTVTIKLGDTILVEYGNVKLRVEAVRETGEPGKLTVDAWGFCTMTDHQGNKVDAVDVARER